MQAVVSTPGGERWAELREIAEPEPGPGELLIEVHAAGINRGELTLVQIRDEFRPGQEVAGIVAAGPRQGERVVGLADWHGWAEYAAVPEHRVVPLPDAIDFRDFLGRDAVRIRTFFSAFYEDRAADNLRTLLGLVAEGRLAVKVGLETPLADINDALDALDARKVPGKAILRVR